MGESFFLKRIKLLIIILSLSTSYFPGTVFAEDLPALFRQTANGRSAQGLYYPTVDSMEVSVDFSQIRPSDDTKAAVLATLPDRTVVLTKNRIETRGVDDYTWFGKVEGYEYSSVILTVVGGVLYGHIDIDGDSYSIGPKNGEYLITMHDITYRIPFDDDVLVPDIKKRSSSAVSEYIYQEDGSRIDVLVLYTQWMLTKYGTDLAALIQYFVDLTNTAYTNSGINTRLRLVHSELYSDSNADEGITIGNALNYITVDSNIETIRDSYKADLVSLLRVYNDGSACGVAWLMQQVNNTFADNAFSVVEVRPVSEADPYYCDDRSFAHEIGHNLGCAHDRDHSSISGAYPYSYGYDIAGEFGTVMSYDGPTITYFSTPLITDNDYPIGIDVGETDSAYNVMTINNTRVTAANFRVAANFIDTTGVFRPSNGALYLKNQNATGFADMMLTYGLPGDKPITGDWDGDGVATIGVFRDGVFYLRNTNTDGVADIVFAFGASTDQPVAGDWDGDGIDTIGVYRDGIFFLRNSNSSGTPDMTFFLGVTGDIGIAGDWDGDGIDTTGVFRPTNGALYLKNANTTGFADIVLTYGLPGDKPVTGDWDGDGVDTIGVYRDGTFMLRNSNTNGFADIVFSLGVPGDEPISGDWDGLP